MSIEIKTAFLPNEPILKIGEKLGLAGSKCVFWQLNHGQNNPIKPIPQTTTLPLKTMKIPLKISRLKVVLVVRKDFHPRPTSIRFALAFLASWRLSFLIGCSVTLPLRWRILSPDTSGQTQFGQLVH
ncbi:MAG: hypothetical protein ABR955_10250 [Verrucomicrobiota bacterium]|jgi:hypothetical protein